MSQSVEPSVVSALLGRHYDESLSAWAELAQQLREPPLAQAVAAAGEQVLSALLEGKALLVAGNGGSAAIASHIAAEFVGKCVQDRRPLPAVNLAESTAVVTAIANDYGFENVFARGVRALGRPGDVLLAMSTSGKSPNILEALRVAQLQGMVTIFLTGASKCSADLARHLLAVPSMSTPRIQEVHLMWAHSWCEAIDVALQPTT